MSRFGATELSVVRSLLLAKSNPLNSLTHLMGSCSSRHRLFSQTDLGKTLSEVIDFGADAVTQSKLDYFSSF